MLIYDYLRQTKYDNLQKYRPHGGILLELYRNLFASDTNVNRFSAYCA